MFARCLLGVSGPYQTLFDVRYSWGGFVIVVLFTVGWLLGIALGLNSIRRKQWNPGAWVWLVGWTVLGTVGFGNVWYQRIHCIRELRTGDFHVLEGPVTSFYLEHGKAAEELTVGGITFKYYSANLSGGGLRWTGGRSSHLHVGADVRIAYDSDGEILRLEVK